MFRQITTIFLLLAFSVQAFHGSARVLDYYLNTSSYAKKCENKAKPKMHCNGKCQMMKKLKEEEKKEQQMPGQKENKNEVLSSKSFFAPVMIPSGFSQKLSYRWSTSLTNNFLFSLFRPPQV